MDSIDDDSFTMDSKSRFNLSTPPGDTKCVSIDLAQ